MPQKGYWTNQRPATPVNSYLATNTFTRGFARFASSTLATLGRPIRGEVSGFSVGFLSPILASVFLDAAAYCFRGFGRVLMSKSSVGSIRPCSFHPSPVPAYTASPMYVSMNF